MIRKAENRDINAIMQITAETINIMKNENNPQWDNNYPARDNFLEDIKNQELFVFEEGGRICGYICINIFEPVEYNGLPWAKNTTATAVHRMAISPANRSNGLATALFKYAEDIAHKNDTLYLKIDTYSLNDKMNTLIKKLGYSFVGQINFKNKPAKFNCYEKQLSP